MDASKNLREEVPPKIVKWAKLEAINNAILNNFKNGEKLNADLINEFFEQPYFTWEESLINKLTETDNSITFDDIKKEWINLAILEFDDWLLDFKECIDKTSDAIQKAYIEEIHDRICIKLWWTPGVPPSLATPPTTGLYNDFDTECPLPTPPSSLNIVWYFNNVSKYLKNKEGSWWAKKTVNILKNITITNEDINNRLTIWDRLNSTIPLSHPSHNMDTKNSFDILTAFEIGKEADRTINIAKDISNKLEWLFSNAFPAINTIIWENTKFRYDEKKLWPEYKWKLVALENNTTITSTDKEEKINELRREYYLKYLKKKNSKIWKTLQQLYENNFDYSKLESSVLTWYLESITDLRIKSLFSNNALNESLEINFGNLDEFKDFYKKLADPTISTLHLDWWIDIPIKKEIETWEHPWLKKNINEYSNKESSYDYLPINFEIKKSDIDALPIDMEDKINLLNFLSRFKDWDTEKYKIWWIEAWSLIYLFFVINSHLPITHIDLDKQKDVENLFWDTRKSKTNQEDPEEKPEEKTEKEKNNLEEFINKVEKLWSWTKFKDWAEIWLPMGKSELPGGGYQWMKVKISNIDKDKWTFTGKVFGWELKFWSKLEWKSRTFEMNQNTLDEFKKISKDSNKIRLMPDPTKSDFNSFKEKLNNKLWTWDLSFPEWVTWDGKNFIHKFTDENNKEKEEKIEYFWVPWNDSISYKIKYNPSNRSFKVSATYNWKDKKNNWKTENVRYSYSRDMDWNNFLIFFTQKWLIPQTEAEYQKAQTKQKEEFKMMNWWKWKLNWFSFNNLKNVFKTIKGNIKKKIDDHNKSQDQKLEDILIGDWWLYGKLANILGFIPSIKQWLWELEQEYYNERDNRSWKKIEYYLKIFQSDPDFWTTFDKIPPFAKILWWKSYKDFIVWLFEAKRWLWDDNIQKAAALLLANIEKWWSPYRWLSEHENKGFWVKVLLWEEHYQQFLRDKTACINARNLAETTKNSWLDKKSLNNQLATCEMDYIINNIRWSYWKAAYSFWSKEQRWLNRDTSTEYIDNPSKRLLSDQFAGKLESAMKWWFTKDSVDAAYRKNKDSINSFEKAEDEFGKMWSSRYQKGAAALRTMLDYDSDKSLRNRAEKFFLLYLLLWDLDIYCDAWVKKQVYWWAKPMSFVPWLLVKERNVAENVAILLDDATDWDFSKNVTQYFHKEYLMWNKWTNYKWLKAELDSRLTDEKLQQIHKYFSELPIKDFSGYKDPQKTILEKFKKALLSEDREETDRSILNNPTNANNGLLTNVDVISKMLNFNKEWVFVWNDSDDINNKKLFRNDVENTIDLNRAKDPKYVNFVLDKYFSRFWIKSTDDRQNVYKWINTAKHYQNEVNEHWWTYPCSHQWQMENWTKFDFPLWTITQNDVDKVLLYALEWKIWARLGSSILPEELKNTLEKFQRFFTIAFNERTLYNDTVKKWAFKSWNLWEDDLFLLWWWDAYKRIKNNDIWNNNDIDDSTDIDSYNKLKPSQRKEILRRIFKVESNYINSEIERIHEWLARNNTLWEKWKLSLNNESPARIIDLQKKLNTTQKKAA